MDTQLIDYVDDEQPLRGYLALPEGRDTVPGILVGHDIMGVREHFHAQARWLASRGYATFALDLFGQRPSKPEEGLALAKALLRDPQALRARVQAAVDVLRNLSQFDSNRLAMVGYCFGGAVALELARAGFSLRAAVCVHGDLLPTHSKVPAAIKAKILVCTGSADPLIPPEQRQAFEIEMTRSDADWELQLLGGARHAFSMPEADRFGVPAAAYHPVADRRSRGLIEQFLSEVL